jgi:hypothetical protein
MTTLLTCGGAACLLTGVALISYQLGRQRGRVILAPDLIAELRDHKTRCIGEPPERVALEIGLLCETDARVS